MIRCCLIALALLFSVCQSIAFCQGNAVEARGKVALNSIMKDPAFSPEAEGAQLVPSARPPGGNKYFFDVIGRDQEAHPIGFGSVKLLPKAKLDVQITVLNNEFEQKSSPDWNRLVPQWDSFVARHWPDYIKTLGWKEALKQYQPGAGTFTLQYGYIKDSVELAAVTLSIRLSDGKVSGVSSIDRRPFLDNDTLPPFPSKDTLLKIVKDEIKAISNFTGKPTALENRIFAPRVLAARKDLAKWFRAVPLRDVKIESLNRYISTINGKAEFMCDLVVKATAPNNETVSLAGTYDESLKRIMVLVPQSRDRSLMPQEEANSDSLQKPVVDVYDLNPRWGWDNTTLLFETTRNVAGRPWWQGNVPVASIGVLKFDGAKSSLKLLRPLKPRGADFNNYKEFASSNGSSLMAGVHDRGGGYLFFLDVEKGKLFLPKPSPRLRSVAERWRNESGDYMRLKTHGFCWIENRPVLIASVVKDEDVNLYALEVTDDDRGKFIDLRPVVTGKGDDVLPGLGKDGNLLAWVNTGVNKSDVRLVVIMDPRNWTVE